MVVFTCQHCGDPVKKPSVEKHYNTKCRFRSPHLTCVDCLKDFGCDEYKSHNQCMTEEQRYSAQGTVFKEQKGKKKQEMYLEMIQKILNSKHLTLSPTQRALLEVCSNHENVPRKPTRFENFLMNVARQIRYKKEDINFVFNIIEDAWKKETQTGISQVNGKENQGKDTTDIQKESEINDITCKKATDEKKCDVGNEEVTNDHRDLKLKKSKKEQQISEPLDINGVDKEKCKEVNEDMYNNEKSSSKRKKEKHREKSSCVDSEDLLNREENEACPVKEAIDNEETETKMSKKQLKKQKKYEKYLAELEKESKSEVNEDNLNADVEGSVDIKKNKKNIKKSKANELESEFLGHTGDKNSGSINQSTKTDSKRSKKRKLEEGVDETPEKRMKEIPEGEERSAANVFNWGDVIIKILLSRSDKELSLKKLGKKVVNEYQAVKQDHKTYEELLAKFNKKINKTKGVRVLRDRAKLIE